MRLSETQIGEGITKKLNTTIYDDIIAFFEANRDVEGANEIFYLGNGWELDLLNDCMAQSLSIELYKKKWGVSVVSMWLEYEDDSFFREYCKEVADCAAYQIERCTTKKIAEREIKCIY